MSRLQAAVVPAVRSKWELKEVSALEPGPNQVLVKIYASGLCFTDVHQTNGELPGPFPRILGHEPVGEIVTITGVRTRRVGDRVGVPWLQASCGRCEWCLRGRPMLCADHGDGADIRQPREPAALYPCGSW
jgi:D-arabinose 1-dehydrogenase-like Zn-dependent alcohol dehydrogenase